MELATRQGGGGQAVGNAQTRFRPRNEANRSDSGFNCTLPPFALSNRSLRPACTVLLCKGGLCSVYGHRPAVRADPPHNTGDGTDIPGHGHLLIAIQQGREERRVDIAAHRNKV
eukprot:GGOE01048664.1.p3 GENE.GGOE01048664.1~~GGOE01048664.1.p3  ORF type:complete len:114 (+),score=2.83 GGOE01048664.1:289-630(+)